MEEELNLNLLQENEKSSTEQFEIC
jgi:hypothetical protein